MAERPFATYDDVIVYTRAAARADDGKVNDVLMDSSDLVESLSRINFPADELAADVDADDVTIPVTDVSAFPKAGLLIIGEERMTYSGKSTDSLSGDLENVVRGAYNSEPQAHEATDDIIVMPIEYADRRVRCEKRVFDYLWTTDGGTKKQESLTGVGARQFHHQRDLRRMVRSIMGHFVRRVHRIV